MRRKTKLYIEGKLLLLLSAPSVMYSVGPDMRSNGFGRGRGSSSAYGIGFGRGRGSSFGFGRGRG